MPEEREFLSRWSKRKLSGQDAETDADTKDTKTAKTAAVGAEHLGEGGPSPAPSGEHDTESHVESDLESDGDSEQEVPAELADVDIDAMDYDSDYTLFMKDNVPEALKRRALRQLWRSNPVLANVDGLNDYDDDFTDAALVVKGLQSAYKIGRGYLTDEDVADEIEDDLEEGAEDLVSEAQDEGSESAEAAERDSDENPDGEAGQESENTRQATASEEAVPESQDGTDDESDDTQSV